MSREIKFRAWDSSREEWLYFVIAPSPENIDSTISFGSKIHNYLLSEKLLDGKTWGQYTGLKDKNGKEIYEGDIVREYEDYYTSDPEYVPEIIGTHLVEYEHNGFWLKDREQNEYGFGETDYMEVIGNIYENPELLKQ